MIELNIVPQFCLLDGTSAQPLPLKGSKAKGLIVLLAFAPEHTRSRVWLKNKLWSDRGEEQAASSLRQCLSDIKRSLGKHADALVATQQNVSLNGECFKFDRSENTKLTAASSEILEDLDTIKDPKFRQWVNELRLELKSVALEHVTESASKIRCNKFLLVIDKVTSSSLVENILISELSTSLTKFIVELPDVEIVNTLDSSPDNIEAEKSSGCRLKINTQSDHTSVFTSVSIESLIDRRVLWNDTIFLPDFTAASLNSPQVLTLCGNIVYQLTEAIKSNKEHVDSESASSVLLHNAITGIFTLDKTQMLDSDQLLRQLYERSGNGQILAWRAFLHSLASIQHQGSDFLGNSADFMELAATAIKQSPNDSVSLFVTSQYELLHYDNPASSLHFAEQGVIKNPLNSLAWAALSNSQLTTDKKNEAIVSAQKAIALGKNSPFKHYLEFFGCMAEAASLRFKQAVVHAEISSAYSPTFKAPLRFLLPLYKATRQPEKYQLCLERLQKLEPDFSLQRFADPDYPISTLRRMGLINFVR